VNLPDRHPLADKATELLGTAVAVALLLVVLLILVWGCATLVDWIAQVGTE